MTRSLVLFEAALTSVFRQHFGRWFLSRLRGYVIFTVVVFWASVIVTGFLALPQREAVALLSMVTLLVIIIMRARHDYLLIREQLAQLNAKQANGLIRLDQAEKLVRRAFYFQKAAIDIALAVILLMWLAPLMVVIAIALKIEGGGPILVRQSRIGLGGRRFAVLKFRTKYRLAGSGRSARKSTKLGRFLIRTSLNELPQLLNVLQGTMSLVGHRPLQVIVNRESISPYYFLTAPGIARFHRAMKIERSNSESVDLERLYVTKWSVVRELSLLLRAISTTVKSVIVAEASSSKHA